MAAAHVDGNVLCFSCATQVKDSFCNTFAGRVVSLRPALKECADGEVNVSTWVSWVELMLTLKTRALCCYIFNVRAVVNDFFLPFRGLIFPFLGTTFRRACHSFFVCNR